MQHFIVWNSCNYRLVGNVTFDILNVWKKKDAVMTKKILPEAESVANNIWWNQVNLARKKTM
jgi:hypothetical protein